MIDHSSMRLGRKAIKTDSRTLRLSPYLTAALAAPPAAHNWSPAVTIPWGMLLNDTLGDCTIAAALHMEMAWAANAVDGKTPIFAPTDAEALAAYESIDGYVPGEPNTDNGGVELDVLNAWRASGIGGKTIYAFASANPQSLTEIKLAVFLFGGIYIGVTLPVSAQRQEVWDVVPDDGGVWGGHAIPILDYDEEGCTCVTWGALKKMTWAFFAKYCDEAYAVLSRQFEVADPSADGDLTPSGFSLEQLRRDLSLIK